MSNIFKNKALEVVVVLFCCLQAADLLSVWRHSPFDRLGGISFLLWLIPALVSLLGDQPNRPMSATFLFLALISVLIGRVLDVNALLAMAVAFSIAALVPFKADLLLWIVGAVAWMPVFGWLASHMPVNVVAGLRVLIAIFASASFLRTHNFNLKTA